MIVALITAVSLVVVSLISVLGQWLSSRNDRAVTLQEVELLQKLEPDNPVYDLLEEIVAARVTGWNARQVAIKRSRRETWRALTVWERLTLFSLPLSVLIAAAMLMAYLLGDSWRNRRDPVLQTTQAICIVSSPQIGKYQFGRAGKDTANDVPVAAAIASQRALEALPLPASPKTAQLFAAALKVRAFYVRDLTDAEKGERSVDDAVVSNAVNALAFDRLITQIAGIEPTCILEALPR